MAKEKNNNKSRKFDLLISRRLIKLSSTIVFVLILCFLYFLIGTLIKSIKLPMIDITSSKLYSLSDQTKEGLKKLEKDITIYAINFGEYDNELPVLDEFAKENSRINIIYVPDLSKNETIKSKYGLSEFNSTALIVECGEKNQMIFGLDLYIQYKDSNRFINLLEEKVINSIITVADENPKKVYIYGSNLLHSLAEDQVTFINDVSIYDNEIEVLTEATIPDDCDLLILPGFGKDISEEQANGIIDYIRRGKNILVLQSDDVSKTEYTNFQKVLAEYNLKLGDGSVFDEINNLHTSPTDPGHPDYIVEQIIPSSVTNGEDRERFILSINTAPIKYLDNDGSVDYEVLCETSDKAFTRTEYYQFDQNGNIITSKTEQDGDYQKEVIGILATKKYDGKESKMILFGSEEISVDVDLTINNSVQYLSHAFQNKLFLSDSFQYLLNNDKNIRVEKVSVRPEFTGEESEFNTFRIALLIGASSVLVLGIVVWAVRRKRI